MRELAFISDNDKALEVLDYHNALKITEEDLISEKDGSSYKIRFNSSLVPVSKMLEYTLSKINIKDINVKDADIEEIIRRLYKEGV